MLNAVFIVQKEIKKMYQENGTSSGNDMGGQHSAGKGDKYRPVDYKKYAENYDKIFPKKVKGGKNGNENRKTKQR